LKNALGADHFNGEKKKEIKKNLKRDLRAFPKNTFPGVFQKMKKKKKNLGTLYQEWRVVL